MKRIAALAFLLLVLAGCATTADSGGAGGIRGVVLLGPMCPVERADSPCPDKPLAGAEVDVMRDGSVSAKVTTDSEGRFTVGVPPGSYTVRAVTTGIQISKPVTVTVPEEGFVDVTLSVDSGIR